MRERMAEMRMQMSAEEHVKLGLQVFLIDRSDRAVRDTTKCASKRMAAVRLQICAEGCVKVCSLALTQRFFTM